MLRPYREGYRRGVCRDRQVHDNRRAGQQSLDLTQLFVARIFAGNDHLGEAEHIFDVAEIRGLGERALDYGVVDAEQLLQHAALLRLQPRKRFVGFRVHADVALQIGDANRACVEYAVRTEQRNLRIFRPVLAEGIHSEQQYVRVKLFCPPPHQSEAAHGLVARQRVA